MVKNVDAEGLGSFSARCHLRFATAAMFLSELCCSCAEPRRWAPPLVTRLGILGVISRI